jgi:Protein of unknown function (DUF2809)
MQRNRWVYVVLTCAVIALGLASRKWALFPASLGKYPGDALYALMAFCALGVLLPRKTTIHNAVLALGFCVAIEFSQLYHGPWIDGLRATTLGHLVLGSHFGWWDLVAYAVGVAVGATGEWLLSRALPRVPAKRRSAGGSGR